MAAATYIPWDESEKLAWDLYKDHNVMGAVMIYCGCRLGLRWSDLRNLTWGDILLKQELLIEEVKTKNTRKTKKVRTVIIDPDTTRFYRQCFMKARLNNKVQNADLIFGRKNNPKVPITTKHANMILKRIEKKFKVSCKVSTHTLRKTFGRRIYDKNPTEHTLIKLSELMQHSSVSYTRIYLGMRQEELNAMYLDM